MIDLHLHTNHSDGTDSVKTLLKKAQEKGLDVISITDHDSLGAYFEIENKPKTFMGTGINNNMNIDKNLINNWIDKVKKI